MPDASDPFAHTACIGTSFREVGFEQLASFVLAPDDHLARRQLADHLGAAELVYLATCNRVEIYVTMPGPVDRLELMAKTAEFFAYRGSVAGPDTFFLHLGSDALQHLFEVNCSLHSLALGETDITRQVRRALDSAVANHLAGNTLKRVFSQASKCSKRVRTHTKLSDTTVSVASIAISKLRKYFGTDGPRTTVLVGVGDMTRKVAQALECYPEGEVIFVNRTRSKAVELADRFGGRAMSLLEFQDSPPEWIDVVFSATSAPVPVITPQSLAPALEARRGAAHFMPLVICDMGVPRDTAPELESTHGVLVVALEQLQDLAERNRAQLREEAEAARKMIRWSVARLAREEQFRALAAQSADAMISGRLSHLSPDDRDAVMSLARSLATRLAKRDVPAPPAHLPLQSRSHASS